MTSPQGSTAAVLGTFNLAAMAAALAQGRTLCAASLLLSALALSGLLFGRPCAQAMGLPLPWPPGLWLATVAGVVQLYYAMRVGFDRRLLQALVDERRPGAARDASAMDASTADADAAQRVDAGLAALGLHRGAAVPRDWPSRWRGARGLLLRQALLVLVQYAGVLLAIVMER